MEQVARLPTRKELWRAALMVMVGDAAITIVSALAFLSREGFWR
jgi:preprotein translocase subunit SecE